MRSHRTIVVACCARLAAVLAVSVYARAHAAPVATTSTGALEGLRAWLALPRQDRPDLKSQRFASAAISKVQSQEAGAALLADHVADVRATREQEWKDRAITMGAHTLKWKEKHFGTKPKDGWNLYISMHGGGGAPAQVNDQQWENQIKLYQPKDSLYIAPRGPTDNWNLWHEAHVDDLFDRLIEDAAVFGEVDRNHVYIMGYSAGGDGVYQLAPRMADRLAAAAMMAGHPNDASPLGLRNIGFALHVGALDDGYKRNKVAAEWKEKLDALQSGDPKGYAHQFQLHERRGHWMNLEDNVAVEWMAGFTRVPLPERVVWNQSSRTHERFYWLATPKEEAKGGQLIVASRKQQNIEIEKAVGVKSVIVMLNDGMVDMDQPVTIRAGGKEVFSGVVPRTIGVLKSSLAGRGDGELMFSGEVRVKIEERP